MDKRCVFLLGIFLLCSCSSTVSAEVRDFDRFAQLGTNGDSPQEALLAEDQELENHVIFAEALRYWADGDGDHAIQALRMLDSRGVKSPAVSETLLNYYLELLQREIRNSNPQLQREAVKAANDAIDAYPDSVPVLRAAGEILRAASLYNEFQELLQKILALDSKNDYANYFSGLYHFMNRDYDRAVPFFLSVTVNTLADGQFEQLALFNSWYYLGMIHAFGGRLKESASCLEKAHDISDNNQDLNRTLGLVSAELLESGRAFEMLNALPAGMKSDEVLTALAALRFWNGETNAGIPDAGDFLPLPLAISQWYAGETGKALSNAQKCLSDKTGPEIPVRYFLYRCYRKLGDDPDAIREAFLIGKKAREIGKSDLALDYFRIVEAASNSRPEIWWLIGSISDEAGDRTAAISNYRKFVDTSTNGEFLVPALIRLAWLYGKDGRTADETDAIRRARELAKTLDDLVRVYNYSGLQFFEKHLWKEAAGEFRKALNAKSDDPETLYLYATCLEENGQRNEAVTLLEKAVEKNPLSSDAENLLAYLYALDNRNLERAMELSRLALQASSDNIAYLDTLGWIYFRKGDFDHSLEVFTRVLFEIDRTTPASKDGLEDIYYHIGMLYEKLSKPAEADQYYRMGWKIAPDSKYFRDRHYQDEGKTN